MLDPKINNAIQRKVRTALRNTNVPDYSINDAANAATGAVGPLVQNLANREPWHKSKVLVGNAVAVMLSVIGLAGLLSQGITDVEVLSIPVGSIIANGYAIYGRISTKPPIGE